MLVAFVVLDAFPFDGVHQERTPTLWRLSQEGGLSRDGGIGELPSVTYTNHATFVTGRSALGHGLVSNIVPIDGEWLPAAEIGPEVATLFDACRAEGFRSAAVVGDQNLIGVCGAEAADVHWPPDGVPPEGTEMQETAGYVADAAVVAAVSELDLDALDFLFLQIDQVDGARHCFGATSDEAQKQCSATDAALGEVVNLLAHRWDDTVMIVVSDHDQEDVGQVPPIDLTRFLAPDVMVGNQGTAALLVGPVGPADVLGVKGIAGLESLDHDHHLVWGEPGQTFGTTPPGRGDHGSPRSAKQLAVVGGGHPSVADLAARLDGYRPPAHLWAGWVAETLGLRWRPEET